MKSLKKKAVIGIAGLMVAGMSLTGCNVAAQQRYDSQKQSLMKGESLEKINLQKKIDREQDPSAIRYIYIMNYGQIVGYYVSKGKISSNGSQIGPENEIINQGGNGNVVDSAQDDGTYGTGDPGIFFFTTDDVMIVTSMDYIQSDQPLAVDVKRLGGTAPAAK